MTVAISDRFTKIQNQLFERAHVEPCELKFLAIGMKKQGIVGERMFLHPEMMPLPLLECSYLTSLSKRQHAILSAMAYGNIYQHISGAEMQTLASNMLVAEKVFTPYSDDFMVLYQETGEEYDHTWAFRTVHSMICRESKTPDPFYGDTVGFFSNEGGYSLGKDDQSINKKSAGLKMLNFLIGDAIRILPPNVVQGAGLGGLWLLYRYVANVTLKQAESYFYEPTSDYEYEPLAVEMTGGHATDEARHYTTSFDLGMELFNAADPWAKNVIRKLLKRVVENYIKVYYLSFGEMIDMAEQGKVPTPYRLGIKSLHMALRHPDFADAQVDVNKLARSWYDQQLGKDLSPVTKKRWRYVAQQLQRLVDAIEIKLDPVYLGDTYDRYHKSLSV